ncbi:MAG: hypothetical protein IPG45_21515 [Deltaproteobacteria bacterium]|nr:hypothetical protein [Deltaproteobacteria bacterium]
MTLRPSWIVATFFGIVACGDPATTPDDLGAASDVGTALDAAADGGVEDGSASTDADSTDVPALDAFSGSDATNDDAMAEADGAQPDASELDVGGPPDGMVADAQVGPDAGFADGCVQVPEWSGSVRVSSDRLGPLRAWSLAGDGTTGFIVAEASRRGAPWGANGAVEQLDLQTRQRTAFTVADSSDIASNADGTMVVASFGGHLYALDTRTGLADAVCVNPSGQPANAPCREPDLSADGRFVVFSSEASDLVLGDLNQARDVFVYDRLSGTTERISVSSVGTGGASDSHAPKISHDGAVVAFVSRANNLVVGDSNGVADSFIRDRVASTTVLASRSTLGDLLAQPVREPITLSGDGDTLAFASDDGALVPGQVSALYLANWRTGAIEGLGPPAALGSQPCDLDRSGSRLIFDSPLTLFDRGTGVFQVVTPGAHCPAQLSEDGQVVLFETSEPLASGDAPGTPDVYALKLGAAGGLVCLPPRQRFLNWGWSWLPELPSGQSEPSYVWTGSEVLAFGGGDGATFVNSGAHLSASSPWSLPTQTTGAPSGRYRHTAAWTGTEMFVWGGENLTPELSDGALYDPVLYRWRPVSPTNAPSPRRRAVGLWTGNRVLVYGGEAAGLPLNTGALYDPNTDSWSSVVSEPLLDARTVPLVAWTGAQLIVYGGQSAGVPSTLLATGALYDPTNNQWSPISTSGAPPARFGAWAGGSLVVWNGSAGGRYDPISDLWEPISSDGAPTESGPMVSVGNHVLLFGETTFAAYDLSRDSWDMLDYETPYPFLHEQRTILWTGADILVFVRVHAGAFPFHFLGPARFGPP